MTFGLPKFKATGKYVLAIIFLNIVLVILLGYEAFFVKDLYSTLAGKFEPNSVLHVSRINLDSYHKVQAQYDELKNYSPDSAEVNNPFVSPKGFNQ